MYLYILLSPYYFHFIETGDWNLYKACITVSSFLVSSELNITAIAEIRVCVCVRTHIQKYIKGDLHLGNQSVTAARQLLGLHWKWRKKIKLGPKQRSECCQVQSQVQGDRRWLLPFLVKDTAPPWGAGEGRPAPEGHAVNKCTNQSTIFLFILK